MSAPGSSQGRPYGSQGGGSGVRRPASGGQTAAGAGPGPAPRAGAGSPAGTGPGGRSNAGNPAARGPQSGTYFDPAAPPTALFDTLAERQATGLTPIKSTQLRRFFSEIKEMYQRFQARTAGEVASERREEIYQRDFAPLFKMVRSKVSYATRPGGQSSVPRDFAAFLTSGIDQVNTADEFRLFALHFEAVVGFMYGLEKVER